MTSRKESPGRRREKREEKQLVAAGRRWKGVWTVTTYLRDGRSSRQRRSLFWQSAASK